MYVFTLHMMFEHIQDKFWGCKLDIHAHALDCRLPLHYLVVSVQIISLHQYAPHHVSNVHNKFQSCAVGVQAATMIYNNTRAELVMCVHAQCMLLCSI